MDFEASMQMNIERSIIASYVYFEQVGVWGQEKPLTIDCELFTIPFHKRIMEKANQTIKKDDSLSLLFLDIQEKVEGTYYEDLWIYILATNPLDKHAFKKYLEVLKIRKIRRELG